MTMLDTVPDRDSIASNANVPELTESSHRLEADLTEFMGLLFSIVADMEKRLAYHMRLYDLTPPQFYVIKTLYENGNQLGIGQIADEHHLTYATMTGIVQRLERFTPPLVERSRSPEDGRRVDVSLTEHGIERFWSVQRSLLEPARHILSLLPVEERQRIIDEVQNYFSLLTQLYPIQSDEAGSSDQS